MLKIAIVTNIPAPYRIPIYQRIAQTREVALQVIFCSAREPNRKWDLPSMEFPYLFLRERFITRNDRYIHNNLDVFPRLKQLLPDVVVTDGFNPTHLYAFAYTLLARSAHVCMTDGTYDSEQTLNFLHRAVRRLVYARSGAFIAASTGGTRLYQSYGIQPGSCFKSHLCVDNSAFSPGSQSEIKTFDFIFCGRIESVKNPLFALEVAFEAAARLNRKLKILFVGSGDQEEAVKARAASRPDLVQAEFKGFANQQELPALYRSARIFLFPTLWDPWGVVANEACAAGLPVLISPHAGAAGEVVFDGQNGFICELDAGLWADRAALLLTQPFFYKSASKRSRSLIKDYNFDNAASGFLDACRFAVSGPDRSLRIVNTSR